MLTPSAIEHLDSIPFAEKRTEDLYNYLLELSDRLHQGKMSLERYEELESSAWGLYSMWVNHLNILENEKERAADPN